MITDYQTNIVYLSDKLTKLFPEENQKLIQLLNQNNIQPRTLINTKDIWCRDFMPIQISKTKFAGFKYDPWYLNLYKSDIKIKSKPEEICQANNIKMEYHPEIKLDGGNVVKASDKVILTNRIFDENPNYQPKKLIKDLERIFECKVIIIPCLDKTTDFTGHSDGMIRFVKDDFVLIYDSPNKKFKNNLIKGLKKNHLEHDILQFFPVRSEISGVGCYINYLQVGNFILMPEFNNKLDAVALSKMEQHFPSATIKTINLDKIYKKGGLLNCMTWNIQE